MSWPSRWYAPRDRRWLGWLAAVCLVLLLLLDAYALYQVYLQRVGNALDYYPFWAGGREVLLHRQNPYDPEVMQGIQEAIYGRPALPNENQHGYAYPAYAPLIVFPFILLPFPASASLWIAFQQFLLVASVLLAVRASGGSAGPWRVLLLCLVAMTFRYTMIVLVLGQTSTWVLAALSLVLWAGASRRGGLAGLALAAGLVKPQLVVLPALALVVSLKSRQRRNLLLSLGGATVLLLAASWLLAGFWADDYWRLLQAYQAYSTTEFPVLALAQRWLSSGASWTLNLAVVLGLLALFAAILWRARGRGDPVLPVATAVVVTQVVVPQTGSYNLTLLVLPAVIVLQRLMQAPVGYRWSALAGRATVWVTLAAVPWLLLPVLRGENSMPVDLIVLPVLILLPLLGTLWFERRNPDTLDAASAEAGAG